MSHFTVLVIGDNVEEQLAPYDENIEVDPRPDDREEDPAEGAFRWLLNPSRLEYEKEHRNVGSPESRAAAERLYEALKDRTYESLTIDEKLDILRSWYSEGTRFEVLDGEIVQYTTYNPKSKWDWYQIGGRWNGFFKLKPGGTGRPVEPHWSEKDQDVTDHNGRSDQARKDQIDFEGMRAEARQKAEAEFAEMETRTQGVEPPEKGWAKLVEDAVRAIGLDPDSDETLSDVDRAKYQSAVDRARAEYNQHPWVKAARGERLVFGDPFVIFHMDSIDPRQKYIDAAVGQVASTYAVVKDGVWFARGEMGWFGMSSDDVDQDTWNAQVAKKIDELPGDTLLTLVDCHI